MTLIIPRVNLNGNTKQSLVDELSDIREKLDAAVSVLKFSDYANGRNYQLNPVGDSAEAYSQHSERVQTLERIANELEEIQFEVSQQ